MNLVDARAVGLGTVVRAPACGCQGPVSRIDAKLRRVAPSEPAQERYRFGIGGHGVMHDASDCEVVRSPDGHHTVDARAMARQIALEHVWVRARGEGGER